MLSLTLISIKCRLFLYGFLRILVAWDPVKGEKTIIRKDGFYDQIKSSFHGRD